MRSLQTYSISFILSLCYVASIYIPLPIWIIKVNSNDRNDPIVIKSRIIRITCFTTIVCLILPYLLKSLNVHTTYWSIIDQMGIIPNLKSLKVSFNVLTLLSILYVGPLINDIYIYGENPFKEYFTQLITIQGFRDLIIGPLTEELVYTSAIIVTLSQSSDVKWQNSELIYIPPLFFSLAHFHHAYHLYLRGNKVLPIVITTIFQLCYTYLFGIFTDYLFIKTDGELWACFMAHSFCNFMGVPQFSSSDSWKKFYYILLVMGLILFIICLKFEWLV